jgi:hypothetical protein
MTWLKIDAPVRRSYHRSSCRRRHHRRRLVSLPPSLSSVPSSFVGSYVRRVVVVVVVVVAFFSPVSRRSRVLRVALTSRPSSSSSSSSSVVADVVAVGFCYRHLFPLTTYRPRTVAGHPLKVERHTCAEEGGPELCRRHCRRQGPLGLERRRPHCRPRRAVCTAVRRLTPPLRSCRWR